MSFVEDIPFRSLSPCDNFYKNWDYSICVANFNEISGKVLVSDQSAPWTLKHPLFYWLLQPKKPLLSFKWSTPQFHTDPLSSTHRFHPRTTPFQNRKSFSSTPKKAIELVWNWGVFSVEVRGMWNWGVFGVKLRGLELRGFWCGTEGFLVLNWRFLRAEKEWLFCVELMCWTEGVPFKCWKADYWRFTGLNSPYKIRAPLFDFIFYTKLLRSKSDFSGFWPVSCCNSKN